MEPARPSFPSLRRYLVGIVIPAVTVTGIGLSVLILQYRTDAARQEQARRACTLNAVDELRDAVREAGTDLQARQRVFAQDPFARKARAAFVWEPRRGIVWERDLAAAERARFAARVHWADWAPSGRKHPPQREVETCRDLPLPTRVAWGRVDGRLYALVFGDYPVAVDSDAWIWLAGGIFVLFLLLVLAGGAVQLWRAAERARRDDRLKTRFVSDVTHELKTPLAAMGLWLDLVRTHRLPDPAAREHALEVIDGEKDRLLRMVESLLDFTRLEQGSRRYHFAVVDAAEVAREVVELLKGDFEAQGVTLSCTGDDRAWADREAVRQILVNLVGNAAKYAASFGLVEVMVSRAGKGVCVAVADRGPGIPAAVRARLFERFYRAGDAVSRSKGGFGLGLSIARPLAEGMKGTLTVEARAGGGSVFLLTLPAAVDAAG